MSYQGWTNYETWCVSLWIDSEQFAQEYWRDTAKACTSTAALAEMLKEKIGDHDCPDLGACLYRDLLHASLGEVNWHEIAEHLMPEEE